MNRVIVLLLLGVLLTECSSADQTQDVDWENYSPTVKTRIDELAAAKDCAGLQREFDTAESNNTAQRNRTGDGNSDLMAYIDDKMAHAGCYDK